MTLKYFYYFICYLTCVTLISITTTTTTKAVFVLWHVRHNIVGVFSPDNNNNNPDKYVKDYIRPVVLRASRVAVAGLLLSFVVIVCYY